MEPLLQQHDSKYFAHRPLPESWVGVTRSKFKFLKNLVMLYIKLNGITNAATLLQIFCPQNPIPFRARKLYTSARIYEWKFGKGEWKLPFASPTGRVDFFWFCNYFEKKKELTSMFYSLQKQRKHIEERSFGRFKMSLKCDRMFTLVSSKCNPVKSG